MSITRTKTAAALADLMQEKGLTNYKLAKEIGVSQTTIKNYLESKTDPQGGILFKLATYFGVNEGYFLGTEPKKSIKKAPRPEAKGLSDVKLALIDYVRKMPEDRAKALYKILTNR